MESKILSYYDVYELVRKVMILDKVFGSVGFYCFLEIVGV